MYKIVNNFLRHFILLEVERQIAPLGLYIYYCKIILFINAKLFYNIPKKRKKKKPPNSKNNNNTFTNLKSNQNNNKKKSFLLNN